MVMRGEEGKLQLMFDFCLYTTSCRGKFSIFMLCIHMHFISFLFHSVLLLHSPARSLGFTILMRFFECEHLEILEVVTVCVGVLFHSDIQFLIGPARKKVFAHRCILSGRCEVFRAMFVDHSQKNGAVEKDVPFVMSDMVPEVFLAMLEFIYTNSVTLTPKIVRILLMMLDLKTLDC